MAASITAVVKGVVVYREDGRPAPPLENFMPEDPDHFGIHVQAFLGAATTDASDSFDVTVCSPSWVVEQRVSKEARGLRAGDPAVMPEGVIAGSGLWLMRRWDSSQVREALRALCEVCSPGPGGWRGQAARAPACRPTADRRVADPILA